MDSLPAPSLPPDNTRKPKEFQIGSRSFSVEDVPNIHLSNLEQECTDIGGTEPVSSTVPFPAVGNQCWIDFTTWTHVLNLTKQQCSY